MYNASGQSPANFNCGQSPAVNSNRTPDDPFNADGSYNTSFNETFNAPFNTSFNAPLNTSFNAPFHANFNAPFPANFPTNFNALNNNAMPTNVSESNVQKNLMNFYDSSPTSTAFNVIDTNDTRARASMVDTKIYGTMKQDNVQRYTTVRTPTMGVKGNVSNSLVQPSFGAEEKQTVLESEREQLLAQLSDPVLKRVPPMEKQKERQMMNVMLKDAIQLLPKSIDVRNGDATDQFIREVEDACPIVMQHPAFLTRLEQHCEGELQLKITLIKDGVHISRLMDGYISGNGDRVMGLNALVKLHERDLRKHTEPGCCTVNLPDAIAVWEAFKKAFARNVSKKWISVHASLLKRPDMVQKEDEDIADFVNYSIYPKLKLWDRSQLDKFPRTLLANYLVAGIEPYLQAILLEEFPELVPHGKLWNWNFDDIYDALLTIEDRPKYAKEKLMRANMTKHKKLDVNEDEEVIAANASTTMVGAVDAANSNRSPSRSAGGSYYDMSMGERRVYDEKCIAIRAKGEEPVRNLYGDFDYFKRDGVCTTDMPVCLKAKGAFEGIVDCEKVGHFCAKCPRNKLLLEKLRRTQRNTPSTVAAVQVDHSEDQWNRQEKVNSALLEMAKFVVSKTTDSPAELEELQSKHDVIKSIDSNS